jgi:putative selenium metabolism hydrolase
MAARVVAEMHQRGFDRVETDEAGSVTGIIEGEEPGPTLLLDAHMDTVDVLPAAAWSRDPFGGEVDSGRLYGRGASDMKGALAAMICAAASFDRARLAGRVVVSASVEEERIEGVALGLICQRLRPDYVVIGEASNLDLVRAGRGRAEVLLRTAGRPAHASTPERGVSAVSKMMAVAAAIEALPRLESPFVGTGVMCLTDIISEPFPAHSVVPSGCRATFERRLLPGETEASVVDLLAEACRAADAADTRIELSRARLETYTGYSIDADKWLAPWELPAEHPLVGRSLAALRASGLEPELASYGFCTNASYTAGEAGIPTIGFGPGREELAHVVDEYVEVEHLTVAESGYRAIIQALLS